MSAQLPIDAFPAWARLNDIDFIHVQIQDVAGKGFGLVADQDLTTAAPPPNEPLSFLKVPRDLVLSADAIDEYAKIDQNFKQLLEGAGRKNKSTRGDILIYILAHLVTSRRNPSSQRIAPTSWTEYLKFLPRSIPVPTMWSQPERLLLRGTSLETALEAKMAALNNEFDELREQSSGLPFWNRLFWERETATLEDWVLADAWYRSRCLELPRQGEAMVPALDMVNHSRHPTAYYEEENDCINLLRRLGTTVSPDEEVTISYGDDKSAAEMLFSYGFIDRDSTPRETLKLPLNMLPDDPLAKAKLHVYKSLPSVKLSREGETVSWESPFAYLMCLNEEDGLEFRVLQDTLGGQQLKLFWQEDDVTEQSSEFEELITDHPLCQVFRLRTVTVLSEQIASHIERISPGPSRDDVQNLVEMGLLRQACVEESELLREIEHSMLMNVAQELERQKNNLLEDEHVLAYLEAMQAGQADQDNSASINDHDVEDDFS